MDFKLNRKGIAELEKGPDVAAARQKVAEEIASEIERNAPSMVKRTGKFHVDVSGDEIKAVVRSPYWHWAEHGTTKQPARPYIRPSVARVLSRHGGKFSTGRS